MLTKQDAEARLKAKQVVYRQLNFRFRSEFEIRVKLSSKGFSTKIIDDVIRYFKELDLIDDEKFVHSWITSRLKKPFGLRRIRIELNRKGIEQTLIDRKIAEFNETLDEETIVLETAQRRAEKYKNIDEAKKRQRLYAYLGRRGFSSQSIIKALRAL